MNDKIELDTFLKAKDDKLIVDISFENGLTLIEQLVEEVESGKMQLEQSIKAYEKGAKLLARLKALLAEAEKKIEMVQVEKNSK